MSIICLGMENTWRKPVMIHSLFNPFIIVSTICGKHMTQSKPRLCSDLLLPAYRPEEIQMHRRSRKYLIENLD